MNTKDNILDNLSEYSPRQLAEYVDKGVITWDDMRDTGDLTPSLRKAIEEQISQIAQVEDKDWERALAAGTKSAFQEYLSKYPSGKFTDAARGRISDLIREDNKIQIENEWDSLDKSDIEALRTFIRENPRSPHVTEARAKINELQREKRRGNGTRFNDPEGWSNLAKNQYLSTSMKQKIWQRALSHRKNNPKADSDAYETSADMILSELISHGEVDDQMLLNATALIR